MRETLASVLCTLAVGQLDLDAAPRRQRGGELGGVQRTDGGVGDQQHVARRDRLRELIGAAP